MGVTRSPRKTGKSAGQPPKKATRPAAKKETAEVAAAPSFVMTLAGTESPADRSSTAARPAPKHPAVAVARSSMEDWPPQAELVLTAIEAGQHAVGPAAERRKGKRVSFRVRAQLRLYSDNPGEPGRAIYTRDIHSRGLGFITPHRLPLGHGGLVDLPTPAGKIVSVPCTLLRCREAAPGWYEGSVYFNRDQHGLVPRNAG
jgi:hypothetical protein